MPTLILKLNILNYIDIELLADTTYPRILIEINVILVVIVVRQVEHEINKALGVMIVRFYNIVS